MPRATRKPLSDCIALAVCAYALPAEGLDDSGLIEMQLMPAGDFRPADGREMLVDHWHIDAAVAQRVIERFRAQRQPPVVDYEHQTLLTETNGQPAPAAGWIRDLVWKEGEGLFALVEPTTRARQYIAAKEYLYVSPVFAYDATTGDVLAIQMAAITNNPALHGMAEMELRAAAVFGSRIPSTHEDHPMNKLLLAVLTALSLPQTTTEEQAVAALTKHFEADPLADVRQALGVDKDVQPEAVVTACTALKTKADAAKPDPSKFVAVATFETVKQELAVLTAKIQGDEVAKLVEKGLEEGRLLPAQKEWATELGQTNIAALTKYLEATAPIAALSGSQTGGRAPEKTDANPEGLTADELAVCTATGIAPKDFVAAKAA